MYYGTGRRRAWTDLQHYPREMFVETGLVGNGHDCLEISCQGKAVLLKILGHALQWAIDYGIR